MEQPTKLTHEELRLLATRIFGSEDKARAWLTEPRPEFDNQSAKELLDTDIGCGQVAMELKRLENNAQTSARHF